ncbi:TPA: hypothetical protein ACWSAL_004776 [Escherichia coli]
MTIPPDAHLHKPDINGTTVLLLKLSELSLCLIFRLSIERKLVPLRSIAFAVDERRAADRTSALALFFISLPPYV